MSDTRQVVTIHDDITLTGSYQQNEVQVRGAYQLELGISYTMHTGETGNSIEVELEFAYEQPGKGTDSDTVWHKQTSTSVSGGTITLSQAEYTFSSTGAGNVDTFQISVPVGCSHVRIGVKETGIDSNGGKATVIASISEEN